MDFNYFPRDDDSRGQGASYTNGFPQAPDFSRYPQRRASYTDIFENGFHQASDFSGYSQRRASFTNGFPQASSFSGFGFSGDRTPPIPNPFPIQHSIRNLTTPSMADTDLGFSSFRNLHECSRFGVHDLDLSFQDIPPSRQSLVQSFHGEASLGGYVGDDDSDLLYRLGLLSLQGRGGFTEHMSHHHHNRDEEEDAPMNLASLVTIYGSVYLTAKTQKGCRVLQKLVEEGSFLDTLIIFREVIDHVTELGMDPFGNYFIQKLLEVCNEEERTQILIKFTSKPSLLVKISLNTYGTRVVQKLIETVSTKEQICLVKSALKPGFLSLVRDLNGNHVILTCLKSLPPNDHKFILEAATMFCTEIATHRHGCCVLRRCVMHSFGVEREKLVAEIARNSLLLSQDPFGNYVVQYIIEQKMEEVSVMFELRGSYITLAKQKFGSHVVEQCLKHYPESRQQIVRELISVPNFEDLLQDPYANYVIQSALSMTKGYIRTSLVEKIKKCRNLKMNPYCKRIFSGSRLLKM